jgi:hypothetical protein
VKKWNGRWLLAAGASYALLASIDIGAGLWQFFVDCLLGLVLMFSLVAARYWNEIDVQPGVPPRPDVDRSGRPIWRFGY